MKEMMINPKGKTKQTNQHHVSCAVDAMITIPNSVNTCVGYMAKKIITKHKTENCYHADKNRKRGHSEDRRERSKSRERNSG